MSHWLARTPPSTVVKCTVPYCAVLYCTALSSFLSPAPNRHAMGVLDKLVLVFDEAWWPRSANFISRELGDLSGRWWARGTFCNRGGPFCPACQTNTRQQVRQLLQRFHPCQQPRLSRSKAHLLLFQTRPCSCLPLPPINECQVRVPKLLRPLQGAHPGGAHAGRHGAGPRGAQRRRGGGGRPAGGGGNRPCAQEVCVCVCV